MKKLSRIIFSLFLAISISFSFPTDTYALSTAKYDSQANQNVTKIANAAARYDSDYDRARYVVSWLIANNNYNEELYEKYENGYDADDLAHYAVSALVPGLSPVCDGYSHAFKQICDKLGLPCYYAEGSSYEEGSNFRHSAYDDDYYDDDYYDDYDDDYDDSDEYGHAWNYIQLSGKWYLLDITEMDTGKGAVNSINWKPSLCNLSKYLYGQKELNKHKYVYKPEGKAPTIAQSGYNAKTAKPSFISKKAYKGSSNFKLSTTSVTLAKKGKKATVTTVKNKSVTVSSTNSKVATAKYTKRSGKITITAKGKGNCKIKVKYSGKTKFIKVKVTK